MMSGNKRGAKRPAFSSDLSSEPSSSSVPSKRAVSLDPQRASSSQKHVRALNNQFASWVQLQLEKHPDELWEDGIKDYLTHAKQIMENFKDVVDFLKAKPTPVPLSRCLVGEKLETPLFPSFNNNNNNSSSNNNNNKLFNWGTNVQSGSQSTFSSSPPGASSEKKESPVEKNKPALKLEINNGFAKKTLNTVFSFSTPQNSDPLPPSGSLFSSEKESLKDNGFKPVKFSFDAEKTSPFTFSNLEQKSMSPFSFGQPMDFSGQPPAFSGMQSFNTNNNASKVEVSGDDNDDETERPSSPSLQQTEEKGVVLVHEAKCKVFIKPDNPAEKGWKDMGVGQLSIKTKEGQIKATKESKPTIVIRNDVGKILLNALIYSGIKTNIQKNTMSSVFHTADEKGSVVTKTYLLRLKNGDEAVKLADIIKENAPSD